MTGGYDPDRLRSRLRAIRLGRVFRVIHRDRRTASCQRAGNRNMTFPAIVEYPFFTRGELSNGVQLADLLACSVYRAFRDEDLGYPYFERVLGSFYRRRQGTALDGLKVRPDRSPLTAPATKAWASYQPHERHQALAARRAEAGVFALGEVQYTSVLRASEHRSVPLAPRLHCGWRRRDVRGLARAWRSAGREDARRGRP